MANQCERKLFTNLSLRTGPLLHDKFATMGFRRNQSILYRPHCDGCKACVSARILVPEFKPSKSQKRVWAKNKNLVRHDMINMATKEQFDLFKKYQQTRHTASDMSLMNALDYAMMLEDSPVATSILEYRDLNSQLVAAMMIDRLSDALSLVYSFFDPDRTQQSLGTYLILDAIDYAASLHLNYVYLGYWVKGSQKMDYKSKFLPQEHFNGQDWVRYAP